MKNFVLTQVFTFVVLLSPTLYAQGPTMHENSFKINGDGFDNREVLLEIRADEFMNNYYGRGTYNYFEDSQNMSIRISGGNKVSSVSPITGIHMDFNRFNGKGIYTLDSALAMSIFFKKDGPTNGYDAQYAIDSDVKISINLFESIGGLIEGTFSGTFVKMVFNKELGVYVDSDVTVSITDGKFSVIHTPDYHWDAPISTGKEPENFQETPDKKKKKKDVN